MDVLLIHSGTYARPFEDRGQRVATYGHAAGAEFSVQAAIDHAGFVPDWILVELFGPRPFLRGVESCDLPIAAYVYDSPLNHFWLRHYLPLFDAAFVDFPDSIDLLGAEGTRAFWSPYAIDPANFPEPAEHKEHDLAFVGASVGRPRREALLELLRANFDIVTGGAARPGDPGRMTLRESAEIYARSRIVVNECLIDGPNFRAFEAMASGALLLTEETRNGLPDLFEEGVHFATYTPSNVVERAHYYLEHESERAEIAAAGRERVLERHSRLARAGEMLSRLADAPGRVLRGEDERTAAAGRAVFHFCRRFPDLAESELPYACELLEAASEKRRDDGTLMWELAMAETQLGDVARALPRMSRATELLPEEPRVLMHLAELLDSSGEPGLARQCAAGALARASAAPEHVRTAVAEAFEGDGRPDWHRALAIGALLEACGHPGPQANGALPEALFGLDAADYHTRAVSQGGDASALLAMGRSHAVGNIWSLAAQCLEAAFEATPGDPEVRFWSGLARLALFDRSEGLARVSHALRSRPDLRSELDRVHLADHERAFLEASTANAAAPTTQSAISSGEPDDVGAGTSGA
jgi:tetratricopeptide (TPR) repeat protein